MRGFMSCWKNFRSVLVDLEEELEDEMEVVEKVDQNAEEEEGFEPQISEPEPAALSITP